MHRLVRRLVRLAAMLALAGALPACYSYRAVPVEQVPVGTAVRARISLAEAEKLEALTGRDDRVLEGALLDKPDSTLLIAVSNVVGFQGGLPQRAQQRVSVPRSGVLEVEIRKLHRARTLGIVALGATAVGAAAFASLGGEKQPNGEGKPNPNERRASWARPAAVTLLAIPFGRR